MTKNSFKITLKTPSKKKYLKMYSKAFLIQFIVSLKLKIIHKNLLGYFATSLPNHVRNRSQQRFIIVRKKSDGFTCPTGSPRSTDAMYVADCAGRKIVIHHQIDSLKYNKI